MASEAIKVNDGTLLVERTGPGKSNLEVSLSDVDSVSFERGGEEEGNSDGTLSLFTKKGEVHTVRVADSEVGKYLKQIYAAKEEKPKQAPATKTTEDNEVVNKK